MELGKVFVDDVVVGENRRPIDKAAVERLAESMKAIGLQTPISIWADDKDRPVLVAGHHRLEAARALGWEQIECCFVAMDADDRRRWEIAENLHRAELTVQQRSDQIAEWVAITNKKAQLAPFSNQGAGRGNKGGVNAAARELGVGRTDIQRAVKIAAITPEAKDAARDAGLDDNQSALLRVAAQKPQKQEQEVRRIIAERSARDDRDEPDIRAMAERIARNLANRQIQELIDHLTDICKRRLAA
jgi:hypothetical protein